MQVNLILTIIIQFLYNSFYTANELFKIYKVEFILSSLTFLMTLLMMYLFTYNPYGILKTFTTTFIFTYVILIAFLISVMSSDNTNKLKIIWKFFKTFGIVIITFYVFRIFFTVTSHSFVFVGKESPISAIVLVISLLALFYKVFIENTQRDTNTKTYNRFVDILFYIPCLLLDFLEILRTNIKILPGSSIIIISGLIVYFAYKYILPFVKRLFSSKDRIKLLSGPKELNVEIMSIDQDEIREKIVENRPFMQKKILEVTTDIEKLIKTQGDFFEVSDEIFNMNTIYENKQVASNAGVLSRLKFYSHCKDAKDITCDSSNNQMMCDGQNVIDFYGMNVQCSGGSTSITDNAINNILVYKSQDKTNRIPLSKLCKFDEDISNVSTGVGCYKYDDIVDDVMNPDKELNGKHVYCCNVLGESVGTKTGSKFKVIYAFNDSSDISSYLTCKTDENTTEGFGNMDNKFYNKKMHALDVHFDKHSYIGIFSKEEQQIVQNALNDDKNTLNDILSMYSKDPDMAKAYIISYFSNNQNYMTFLQHINNYNLKTRKYLNQEISEFIKYYHMRNNISSYNYHYGISFWVYFDQSILNQHGEYKEGLIMDYELQPRIVYDYGNQQILAIIKDCERNNTKNGKCSNEVIYKTDKILFQKWNNFIINFNYGTLDIFVNNNLVCSVPGVSPYIEQDKYAITFGSETNPLKNCAICNVEYFEYPLDLVQIKNIYKKKDNPC
jgi:hypothetical protein